jgi:hypothetical protein
MGSLVSENAAGIVGEEAPVAEPVGVEGAAGSGALPLLPVERAVQFGGSCDAEVVVEPPGAHHADGAEGTGGDDAAGVLVEVVAAALHADLDDVLRTLLGVDQGDALLGSLAEGFFDVDVLAGGEGVEHHLSVPVLRGGDEDGGDVLVFEQGLVVAIGLGRLGLAPGGGGEGALEVRFIDVADRADPNGRVLLEHGHDESTAAAGADDAERDLVRGGRSGGEGGAGGEEEPAAAEFHWARPAGGEGTRPPLFSSLKPISVA